MHKHEIRKSDKNILIAFFLNFSFAIFELIGGVFTSSISIVSDAFHDALDALSIGVSFILERRSKKESNSFYTFGYLRYSTLGALITTVILLVGALIVIYHSVLRLFNPVTVNYNGMIVFAVIGVIVNMLAAFYTKEGDSLNQKSVNLHMLEDVLGWIVVLIGSIIMKFTSINYLDSIMSILISIYLIIEALKNLKEILDLFLEKVPNDLSVNEVREEVLKIKGVKDVHHIHLWSIDGNKNYATMHIVSDSNIKDIVREKLKEMKINHVTIEMENTKEECFDKKCH